MKIAIGSDKSGFSAKEAIKAYLTEAGIEFDDLGTQDLDHVVPYYAVADKVAPLCSRANMTRPSLSAARARVCASCPTSSRRVRPLPCEGVYSAKMARAINNANILCMGGWIVGPEMAVEMVKTFLATEWCQDLEDWRKENMKKFAVQVAAIEDKVYDK